MKGIAILPVPQRQCALRMLPMAFLWILFIPVMLRDKAEDRKRISADFFIRFRFDLTPSGKNLSFRPRFSLTAYPWKSELTSSSPTFPTQQNVEPPAQP